MFRSTLTKSASQLFSSSAEASVLAGNVLVAVIQDFLEDLGLDLDDRDAAGTAGLDQEHDRRRLPRRHPIHLELRAVGALEFDLTTLRRRRSRYVDRLNDLKYLTVEELDHLVAAIHP